MQVTPTGWLSVRVIVWSLTNIIIIIIIVVVVVVVVVATDGELDPLLPRSFTSFCHSAHFACMSHHTAHHHRTPPHSVDSFVCEIRANYNTCILFV